MVVKFGALTHVFSVPTDTTSIKTESAARFRELASNSTQRKESAKSATKATQLSMVNAPSLTPPPKSISDAPSGKVESALPALNVGTSTPPKFAPPSVTYAPPGMMLPEPASPATTDTPSPTEPVP